MFFTFLQESTFATAVFSLLKSLQASCYQFKKIVFPSELSEKEKTG